MDVKLVNALVVKFLLQGALLTILLPWTFHVSIGRAIFVSATLWAVSFLIGDMAILPATNAVIAAFSDFVLAAVALYLMMRGVAPRETFAGVVAVAAVIGIAEYFYHHYLMELHLVDRI